MSSPSSEYQRFSTLLVDLRQQLTELKTFVDKLFSAVRCEKTEKDKGISLLELKCHLMLGYLTNLSYLCLCKLSKKTIKGDDVIFRLAEIRTVLERVRPIEQKLQYQIDKLISTASSSNDATGNNGDALSYKPNPNALVAKEEGESEQSDEEGNAIPANRGKKNANKYLPPKLLAVPYTEESDKANKAIEKARKRALSSSLVRDLQEQYGHGPEEVVDVENSRRKELESQREQQRYEEENFIRLQMNKAQKQAAKRVSAKSTLKSLLEFGDYHVDELPDAKKRKRSISKRKGRGKGKGKRKG